MYRVCIDTGGTFTDCVVLDGEGASAPIQGAHHAGGLLRGSAEHHRGRRRILRAQYPGVPAADGMAGARHDGVHQRAGAEEALADGPHHHQGVQGHHRDAALGQDRDPLDVRGLYPAVRAARPAPAAFHGVRDDQGFRRDRHAAGRGRTARGARSGSRSSRSRLSPSASSTRTPTPRTSSGRRRYAPRSSPGCSSRAPACFSPRWGSTSAKAPA